MIEVTINLNNIASVKDFVTLTNMCKDKVIAYSGRYVVDAKSIMGIFSLDLSKPLKIEFYGDIPREVQEGMKRYVIG